MDNKSEDYFRGTTEEGNKLAKKVATTPENYNKGSGDDAAQLLSFTEAIDDMVPGENANKKSVYETISIANDSSHLSKADNQLAIFEKLKSEIKRLRDGRSKDKKELDATIEAYPQMASLLKNADSKNFEKFIEEVEFRENKIRELIENN